MKYCANIMCGFYDDKEDYNCADGREICGCLIPEKKDSMKHYVMLDAGWRDARKEFPKYYKPVLLYVRLKYECEGKEYIRHFMYEGYRHTDMIYCDYSGESILCSYGETVIAWRELPDPPTGI